MEYDFTKDLNIYEEDVDKLEAEINRNVEEVRVTKEILEESKRNHN